MEVISTVGRGISIIPVVYTQWCQDILKSICKSGESDTPPYRADTILQTGGLLLTERERYGDINIINEDYFHCSPRSSLLPKICLSAEEKVSEQYVKIMKGDTVIL